MGILKHFDTKNFNDTSRRKCADMLRPQYVGSSCKQYIQWEYWNIFVQKVMHEDLLYFKNLWEFYQLFMYDFLSQNVSIPDILL